MCPVGRRPSRYDLSAARREYLSAVAGLHAALTRFHEAGVPLPLAARHQFQPWTSDQVRAVVGLQQAWTAIVQTRKLYERLVRDDAE